MENGIKGKNTAGICEADIDRLCAMSALSVCDAEERERLVSEVSEIVGFARAVCDAAGDESDAPELDGVCNVQRKDNVSDWDGGEMLSASHSDGRYVRVPRMMG